MKTSSDLFSPENLFCLTKIDAFVQNDTFATKDYTIFLQKCQEVLRRKAVKSDGKALYIPRTL